ncbi:MAG: glycoside hydrolase family 2 protein [Bacteroidetes bacterium]|nr:glycoside hydrolase family 2 protein [Bacteroidota bacterium]
MKIFFSLFFFLFYLSNPLAQTVKRSLNKESWEFSQENKNDWYPAKIPGYVTTDLLKNKKIEDPFWGDNEKKVQWIENESWTYRSSFNVHEKELKQEHIDLVFEGLDTYAEVKLNGRIILNANNAFRTWKVDVKNELLIGRNSLEITFQSSVKEGKKAASLLPYALPENERVFVRKPQYQFGWDWGPRLVASGIWKPIYLNSWSTAQIQEVKHQQKIESNKATVNFMLTIIAEDEGDYQLFINQKSKNLALKKGLNTVQFPFEIKNPKLWWTHDMGMPYQYSFSILLLKDRKIIADKTQKIGIRSVELVQDKDKFGKSFYFKLNGKPLYIRGSNTIPIHSFPTEEHHGRYKTMVNEALFAQMNMLRVWGGGLYEADEFYNLCDEKGILVWQDFPFACAMYPGDQDFLDNVKHEAEDNVNRLQNHPSLAIWCGNNENDEGWHNWGWQKQLGYSKTDSAKIWKDYVQLFRNIIPTTLDSVSGQKSIYWQSSPSNGWGRKQAYTEGDVHYWGVWWGMEPFEKYREKVGRFVSEYGFQSMPNWESFQSFTENINFEDPGVINHQKHKIGYQTIRTYMERDFPVPDKFEDFIYVSQLLQARGMQIAIEAHRTAKPYNMGTLYWQLNDVWPVTSWSSLDYFGRRKAAHYEIKKAFQPILLSVKEQEQDYEVIMVNDLPKSENGNLIIQLKDWKGSILKTWNAKVEIGNFSAQSILQLSKTECKEWDGKNTYLSLEWMGKESVKAFYFFKAPKDLALVQPNIKVKQLNKKKIEVSTDFMAKNVYLKNIFGNLSDNYFDLEAGEKKIITSDSEIEITEVKSLFDIQKK